MKSIQRPLFPLLRIISALFAVHNKDRECFSCDIVETIRIQVVVDKKVYYQPLKLDNDDIISALIYEHSFCDLQQRAKNMLKIDTDLDQRKKKENSFLVVKRKKESSNSHTLTHAKEVPLNYIKALRDASLLKRGRIYILASTTVVFCLLISILVLQHRVFSKKTYSFARITKADPETFLLSVSFFILFNSRTSRKFAAILTEIKKARFVSCVYYHFAGD